MTKLIAILSAALFAAFSLTAAPEALEERLQKDIEAGLRKPDVIGRSLSYLPLYEALNTQKLDTTGKTVEEVCESLLVL